MSNYDALVTKLREIFQIDRPELDFGVYRILNARADEINAYLSTRLKERVAEALASGNQASSEHLQRDLDDAIKAAQGLGFDPETTVKVKDLRAALKDAASGASEHENAVFTHLLAFFSRYYDKGDFISQRRYKGDTYAIPYAGEEVVLHWANKDQYYTKSGEAFSNYAFRLDDGRTVHFRLVAADTAKDNRKDNDKERRFVLAEARTVELIDEDGEPYEDEIVPITEEGGDLVIRFEYRAMPKGSKQDVLVDQAVAAVLGDETVKAGWQGLTERAPTEKNPQRTLLEKHLSTYTQKNTADYFIHKDLGGFLRRELDFYVKNEVMNLDDVQNAQAFAAIEKNLRMIQCLRAIALDLITFLASIEDFQKKLWLKKKFVVAAHYCVTLDRVPETLYPAIAGNQAQWAQWHDLGMRDSADAGSVDDLKASPYLMVDTALFDAAFRADLLKAIPDLDGSMDGLLVHGDNFQALTLLSERYREKVKCVYIDPPYNTSEATFFYKNQYKHSSWLTMIEGRVGASKKFMTRDCIFQITIDDMELYRLKSSLDEIFSEEKYIGTIAIQSNPRGRGINSFFATSHDYAVAYANNPEVAIICDEVLSDEQGEGYKYEDEISEYRLLPFRRSGGLSTPDDRPNSEYPLFVDRESNRIVGIGGKRTADYPSEYEAISAFRIIDGEIKEVTFESLTSDVALARVMPIDSNGERRVWRWSDRQKILEHVLIGDFIAKRQGEGEYSVQLKDRIKEGRKPKTIWIDPSLDASSHGTNLLKNIIGGRKAFGYPKALYATKASISAVVRKDKEAIVLDYFGGSGTTAHAVMSLNRDDKGERRYILVEQGDYFDPVLRRRAQKIVYSDTWSDGRPTAPETGISHAFKVLKIESYEDTLNNLNLKRDDAQTGLLDAVTSGARDDYLIRYMLDVEARGSILSVEDLRKPFDYTLNIAVDSAGAYAPTKIDLVETFNYLIGLTVRHIDIQLKQGFVAVEGTLPTGERTLVLWRDCDTLDYEGLAKLCDKLAINPADSEYEVVYINGDHNIPSVLTSSAEDGEVTKTLKLRQIEPAFLEAMFETGDA
ncbi:site-specific DNA-methyltransferase [Allosphingosinicella flava]|uniref:site-specific DNA-methyltransferase (adenine-specific) n=1 Tax=Allosphingosinicella flava TaxID=2771430 RepID=A0A7T2LMM3_9SPHN|nr:site-specific DNA-methyltransferase [Sphingosinicella flava]QPQ55433.1 site-specific DNA-methyltransferase [Sphingosinicella flava]